LIQPILPKKQMTEEDYALTICQLNLHPSSLSLKSQRFRNFFLLPQKYSMAKVSGTATVSIGN